MTISPSIRWEGQAAFNAALQAKLSTLAKDKVPAAINKTAFFVALKAMQLTPKKEPFQIEKELLKEVSATNKKGYVRKIPILWVMAAKRLGPKWPEKKLDIQAKRVRAINAQKQWRMALKKGAKSIMGGRRSAAGFLRVGWLSVVQALRTFAPKSTTGAVYMADKSLKIRGAMKGTVIPAAPGTTTICKITNSASALSDRKNGLIRLGGPALQRALDAETKGIIEHLDEATRATLNGKI